MYKYHSENLWAPIDALRLWCCTQIPICSVHASGHPNHPMQSLPVLHSQGSHKCKTGRSNGSKDRERPNLRYLDHSCYLIWVGIGRTPAEQTVVCNYMTSFGAFGFCGCFWNTSRLETWKTKWQGLQGPLGPSSWKILLSQTVSSPDQQKWLTVTIPFTSISNLCI